MSQRREGTRLRKERQRDRERAEGLQTAEIRLPSEALVSLTRAALLTFTDPKELASSLILQGLASYESKVSHLEERAGLLWIRAEPYLRYGADLEGRGASVTVHGKTLTHADWRTVTADLRNVRNALEALGWTSSRVERFLRRSARRIALRRKQSAPNSRRERNREP